MYTDDYLYANMNPYNDSLCHYGVKGMKWGVRRYQDISGRLTSAGKTRYFKKNSVSGEVPNFKSKDSKYWSRIRKNDSKIPRGSKMYSFTYGDKKPKRFYATKFDAYSSIDSEMHEMQYITGGKPKFTIYKTSRDISVRGTNNNGSSNVYDARIDPETSSYMDYPITFDGNYNTMLNPTSSIIGEDQIYKYSRSLQ